MKSLSGRSFVRLTTWVILLAVAAGAAVVLIGGAASAALPAGTLGTLTLTPSTGTDTTVPQVMTSAGCPSDPDDDSYNVIVNGPNNFNNVFLVSTISAGISFHSPFSTPFGVSMEAAAANNNTSLVAGEYDVTLQCVNGFTGQLFGTFTTAMNFSSPTAYTTTPPPGPPGNADYFFPPAPPRLSVTPDSPVSANTTETLTALTDVIFSQPPASLQFMDNGISIGSSVPVVNSSASITTTLPPGTHTLTATFAGHCPTGPYPGFTIGCLGGTTSTSNAVTYVVNPSPPTPSPIPPPGITPTTTTLQVAPKLGFTFFPEFMIARVSPFNAVGAVQFMDENTALGSPVPVTAGFAFLFAPLPMGTHSLTAVFTPTDPAAFAPSTSAPVPLTVNPLLSRGTLR